MSVLIDGEKFTVRELEGTDLDLVRQFCNKNKIKAAAMIYIDRDGEVDLTGFAKDEQSGKALDRILNRHFQ